MENAMKLLITSLVIMCLAFAAIPAFADAWSYNSGYAAAPPFSMGYPVTTLGYAQPIVWSSAYAAGSDWAWSIDFYFWVPTGYLVTYLEYDIFNGLFQSASSFSRP